MSVQQHDREFGWCADFVGCNSDSGHRVRPGRTFPHQAAGAGAAWLRAAERCLSSPMLLFANRFSDRSIARTLHEVTNTTAAVFPTQAQTRPPFPGLQNRLSSWIEVRGRISAQHISYYGYLTSSVRLMAFFPDCPFIPLKMLSLLSVHRLFIKTHNTKTKGAHNPKCWQGCGGAWAIMGCWSQRSWETRLRKLWVSIRLNIQ